MTSAPSSDSAAYVHPDQARMAAWRRVYENCLEVEDIVAGVFGDIEVETWRMVAYRPPDRAAVADYLHGINVPDWAEKVDLLSPPVQITKSGAHVWASR